MTLKIYFDLKMIFKHELGLGCRLLALNTMGKVAFHKALVVTGAVIWHSLFPVLAIIIGFCANRPPKVEPSLRWFLKAVYPYVTP